MRALKTMVVSVVMVLLLTSGRGHAAPVDEELAEAEQTLKEARVATDGPSLLKFFEQRTLSEAARKKLTDLVRLLGDEEFAVRKKAFKDLRTAGPPALRVLRPALQDRDPQIARSAGELVQHIDGGSESALRLAAARVLAARKPAGGARVLLAYLPMDDDENMREAAFRALAAVAVQNGKVDAALSAALEHKDPVQRRAAAFVHVQGGPQLRKAVLPLLKDADAQVRFEAAAGFVGAGDKAGMPVLIALLGQGPLELAWGAESILYNVAGTQEVTELTLGDTAEGRRKYQGAWADWWKKSGPKVDLARLKLKPTLLGRNVVCECGAGKHPQGYVWEFGKKGKVRWEFDNVNTPVDVQALPGGRVLVAVWNQNEVTERDRKGKVVWTYQTGAVARSCQRLANGNTFIATTNEVLEVTRKKVKVFSYVRQDTIHRARKLPNGHIVYLSSQGRVVHLNQKGTEVRTINVPGGGGSFGDVDLLPNGRYLVALYSANKVLELDKNGKELWTLVVDSPSSVTRLPNGNTLVSSMNKQRVVEFNKLGNEVWSKPTPGRPFCVRRY